MLSILIPIYNFDVTNLVKELLLQANTQKIDFEILCFDDASSVEFTTKNNALAVLPNVIYQELSQNIGRSKIRNLLAEKAKYNQLLFLDCDSSIPSKDFIKNYIINSMQHAVVCGGRSYEQNPPTDKSKYFRWWYGTNREVSTSSERAKRPYHSFMTNNFLVPKSVFLSIRLDEKLQGYGHEDTLFGVELKKKNIQIVHINNPLCHIGLETTDEFLNKTKEGIKNLWVLIQSNKVDKTVKLYRYYSLINLLKLETRVYNYFIKNQKKIEAQFTQEKSNLRWFDIYKLGYLISLTKE